APRAGSVNERRERALLDLLTLEEVDANLYRAQNTDPNDDLRPTLYGGQVAAQALRAAAHTVPGDRRPHSMHGYFLRAGRRERPIAMLVDRDRDGRSFSARHVNALQDGEVIFSALASFHVAESGADFEEPALRLDVEPPEAVPEHERVGHNVMFDIRYLPPSTAEEPWRSNRMWVRPRATLPDDDVVRACVMAYVSDMGWAFHDVRSADGRRIGGPSIDHAVWFQRLFPVGDWMLLDLRPQSVAGARGVFTGTIHHRDGALSALLAQETLLRPVP
ncbi:MAG TPA: acyl-CoA thioesterase domain-containing protein, partial [Acidimicrobiia bacterium]|nr:acyl-CoA thioesterase domain-containing protein [Acidimicrobiia bacterium]